MPGIIQQQINTPLPGEEANTDPAAANSVTGYDPERIELDEQRDTVAGRINSIVAQNSPLQQQAMTRSKQDANKRGLLNSSMAVQAGQEAVIASALPIATQDAATSYNARQTNAAAGNAALNQTTVGAQALEQGAQTGAIQSRLQAEQGVIEGGQIAQRGDIESRQIQEQGAVEGGLIETRGQVDSRLQTERGDIEMQLQTAEGAIRENLLARQGEIDAALAESRFGYESELQAEQGQIQQDLQTADGQIRADLLERQGVIDAELIAVRGQIETDLQTQRGAIDLELQNADGATREQLLIQQGRIDMDLANNRGDIESSLQAERGVIELELQAAEGQIREDLVARQGEIDAGLQELRTQGALQVADVEGQYRTLIQTSQSATVFYAEITQQIGSILANDRIRASEKQSLINQLTAQLDDGLALIGTLGDVDLSSILGADGSPISPGGTPVYPYPATPDIPQYIPGSGRVGL